MGFDAEEFAAAGRYIEADFGDVTVGSLYLPTGEAQTPKQDDKERFMKGFGAYLADRSAAVTAQGRDMVVCGDWNIAHDRARHQELEGQPQEIGLPSRGAGLGGAICSMPAGGMWSATSHGDVRRARIRGGPTAAKHSTPTRGGGSTTTS